MPARPTGALLFAALLAFGLLAGCQGLQLPEPGKKPGAKAATATAPAGAPARSIAPKPPSRITVDGVVIAGPEGYCIDKRASRAGFALLASCSAISQSPDHPAPGRKGLLTATVGKAGSGDASISPVPLNSYFRSAEGRATLSNTGNPASVRIADTQIRGSAFYVALLDSAPPSQPDLGPARWRALFTVNGRLVSVVLHSLTEDPIGRDAGLSLLQSFVSRIQQASGGSATTRSRQSPSRVHLQD